MISFSHWTFWERVVPPMLRGYWSYIEPPWISSQFYYDPQEIFYLFPLFPMEIHVFFLKLLHTSLEFQRLLLHPLEFFFWYPQQGCYRFFFFWKSLLTGLTLFLNWNLILIEWWYIDKLGVTLTTKFYYH